MDRSGVGRVQTADRRHSAQQDDPHRQTTHTAYPEPMTRTTHWADRYLRRKIEKVDHDAEEAAMAGFEPEASEYMDDLAPFDPSDLTHEHRVEYLEGAVHALVDAMESDDGVAEQDCGVRRAMAFSDDDPVVAVLDGFGELLSLDRETAALVAFAYYLDPESGVDGPDE